MLQSQTIAPRQAPGLRLPEAAHPAIAILFVLFFPLIVEYVYSDFVRESELNTRVGWFLLLLAAFGIFRHKVFRGATLGLFAVSGSLDSLYATTFGGVFTSASFEALALTDSHEAFEFVRAYAGLENLGLLAVYLTGSAYLIGKTRLPEKKTRWTLLVMVLGAVFMATASYRILIMKSYYDTIPGFLGTMPSYFAGFETVAKETEQRKKLVESSNVAVALAQPDAPQTYVFIIGESLARRHMGVYGYHRDTTPQLSALGNELAVFKNVVSAYAQTQPSLRDALTQTSSDTRLDVSNALSIVDMANKAGFKTWWISNQQPLRRTISAIAAMADETKFISNDYNGVEVRRFDGFLMPYITQALEDDTPKKAIFIHLMGSHLQYANRYPDEFARFTGNDVHGFQSALSARQIDYINAYDNSVLYTDHIVSSVINLLKEKTQDRIGAALFFADHGEEVYDSKDFTGHGPDGTTNGMLEIPFIAWVSNEYREQRPLPLGNLSKPYMLDDAFHTMIDVMGMETVVLDKTRSLVAADYRAKPRMIYGKLYDGMN
jgi:heptose-I-phosphate ethanolaminephosphotransferase